jgi:hypothetical protein
MKVELHLHTSRYSGCAHNTPAEMMQAMIAARYDAVFITEHDAVWSDWEIEQLQAIFPDILIFPGVELTLREQPLVHLIVLGTTDEEYLLLRPDPAAVMEKARSEGHLTLLAHPFRYEGAAEVLETPGEVPLPDALEYRSNNHDETMAAQSPSAGRRRGIKIVNAGDIHTVEKVNRFWIETHRPMARADNIREIVLHGQYDLCMREK